MGCWPLLRNKDLAAPVNIFQISGFQGMNSRWLSLSLKIPLVMDAVLSPQERKDKRKGMITSTIVHALAILLLLLPLLNYPDPPPGQEGILVNLGLPDEGQGSENAGPATPAVAEPTPPQPDPEPQPKEVTPTTSKPKDTKVVTTEDPSAIALKKQQEEKRKADEQARQKAAQEEARRKAAAEEEARRQAEADQMKNKVSGLFGSGGGKGNTGKPGNQGDPDGDPNAKNLEGVSTGVGTVGGNLGGRGVSSAPKITDNSQNQGKVVIDVCVDGDGNVISASVTQRGTTATAPTLISLAESNARKWKFKPSDIDKQCGTITYNFQVK